MVYLRECLSILLSIPRLQEDGDMSSMLLVQTAGTNGTTLTSVR